MKILLACITTLAILTAPVLADGDDDDDAPTFGSAGILSRDNREDLAPLMLSSGMQRKRKE